jgi:RND family efflux transporter MFP subunit
MGNLKEMSASVLRGVRAHKIVAGIIALAIVGGGYMAAHAFSGGQGETKYTLATVTRGSIVSVVSGTGQVSASRNVELDAKASGELTNVAVKEGQEVHTGDLIASIDLGTAGFELENAKLSYEKTVSDNAKTATDASQSVADAYQSARSELANDATDLTDAMTSLAALYAKNGYLSAQNYQSEGSIAADLGDAGHQSYSAADNQVKKYLAAYHAASLSDTGNVDSLLVSAETVTQTVANAVKKTNDAVVYLRDHETSDSTAANNAYSTVTNLSSTLNARVSSVAKAQSSIADATHTLATERSGAGTLDVRSEQLSLSEKQDAYNDHFITAPFDGVIAKVSAKTGDTVNSGTAVATIVTKEELVEITLNEVDVAKIKTGDKATITFDAIDGLSITGTVAEIEGVGTVSQGVVSYGVTIAFDTQDERVKPGMSASADIQSAVATEVLTVPSAAVKAMNGESYVQVVSPAVSTTNSSAVALATAPIATPVTVGISDDTETEITSGLSEGEQVVVRAATGNTTTKSTAASATSATRGFGGGNAVFRAP